MRCVADRNHATIFGGHELAHGALEQLTPLVAEYGAEIEVDVGDQEIAYPYVFETGDELGRGGATAADLARYFPAPSLAVSSPLWSQGSIRSG